MNGKTSSSAAILAACLLAGACTTTSPSRSTLQQKVGASGGISSSELRLRLYEMPQRLGGVLETAADRIRAQSADPAVRRRALLWKAEAIPALYTAALRPDPLAGALDLWVLLYQMDFDYESGTAKSAFGPQQAIAVDALKKMLEIFEATAAPLYPDHGAYLRHQADVRAFARAHPLESSFASRETVVTELARFSVDENAGTLAAVGQATDTLADISLRLNAYVTLVPEVARWQAELAAEDVTGRENLGGTLDDVHTIAGAADRANALLADVPGAARQAAGPMRELLDQQRAEMIAAVDREREAMTGFITSERQAALAAVSEERKAALESVSAERAAVLAGLDALSKRTLDDASARARGIADHVFWRTLVLVAAAAVLFAAAYRFGRRRLPSAE